MVEPYSATRSATRRGFLKFSAGAAGCVFAPAMGMGVPPYRLAGQSNPAKDANENIIGPKPGYSPQVGTMVSMLTWMQEAIYRSTQGLTQANLDYLFDAEANTIGALMLHLAASEVFYQANTFEGKDWSEAMKQKWGPAMELGDAGRKTIKGHDREYYLAILKETREKSLAEFVKRDDAWLMTVDKTWGWGPTNNYCKWFHVCEHISHHSGQIEFLRKRVPGVAKREE
jgi:hypothetical protein